MSVKIGLRGLPYRVLGLALCLWRLGNLFGLDSQAQITVPRPGENLDLIGPNFIISPELGETLGANLLHRFLEFNVDTSESVTFTGQSFDNIISLITGENPSRIHGTLRSDVVGANLFLLNPNGILFGANVRLSVNGSFHVSTADAVRFSDGTIFSADGTILTGDLGDVGHLTVESLAFGFLPNSPSDVGSIVIEGTNLRVPAGEPLSVIGGDITVTESLLLAPGGNLTLISVGPPSQGDVPLVAPPLSDLVETFEDLGTIALSNNTSLTTSGNGGGHLVIRGGQLTVDRSAIESSNNGSMDSQGIGIDIGVNGTIRLLNTTEVRSSSGNRRGGDINITAHEVFITEGASIVTSGTGMGRAGAVRIHADASVTIQDTQDDTFLAGIFSFAGFESEAGVIPILQASASSWMAVPLVHLLMLRSDEGRHDLAMSRSSSTV